MPSTSDKQHRFMQAVANNPKFAAKADVPQSVGKEFVKADAAKAKQTQSVSEQLTRRLDKRDKK